jgi:transcription elongation factor SPT5
MERRVHQDERRHKDLDRRKQREEEVDVEQMAERFKEKYGRGAYTTAGLYKGDTAHISQAVLIPSVNDPKLWMVRCKPGREKDIVFHMMRKFFDLELSRTPLHIHSAFARETLKGYIYLEADKQSDVQRAIDKVNHLYISTLRLVPIPEMVDCLHIKSKPPQVQLGGWVRIKRGKYVKDIAQVIEILENGDTVLLKLIPRLDDRDGGKGGSGRKSDRPPQKLFNPTDHNRREVQATRTGYSFRGESFDKNGYMERSMKISALLTEGVNPTLDEMAQFTNGSAEGAEEEISRIAGAVVSKGSDFHVGDSVEVIAGQLIDVPGVVVSVENDIVMVKPDASYGLSVGRGGEGVAASCVGCARCGAGGTRAGGAVVADAASVPVTHIHRR